MCRVTRPKSDWAVSWPPLGRNHGHQRAVSWPPTGSLSLVVSLPTMLVSFTRYSRDNSFQVPSGQQAFVIAMTIGSIAGTLLGGLLLGVVPTLC